MRVLDGRLAEAIYAAVERDCHVISISLGGVGFLRPLREALQEAVRRGVIVLAAAGQPAPVVVAPASYPECLGVAGSTPDRRPWRWSGRGDEVDFSAPAVDVPVASPVRGDPASDRLQGGTGTSFAVALAAGAAALWLAHHGRDAIAAQFGGPGQIAGAFRSAVRESVQPGSEWNGAYGPGILDVAALLRLPLDEIPAPDDILPQIPEPAERAVARAATLASGLGAESAGRWAETLFAGRSELGVYGGELVHRLAQEIARSAAAGVPPATPAAEAADPGSALTQRLAQTASPELRAALRAHPVAT